ncbi:hypothetical protein DKX38_008894 [Salix brachista]|uniref:Uncharacterized protein n=1 Tax=Salix brachista TaxID=2182728 RepID=A0A5N5MBE5_9ROSI|nr:hypothetical protein DKX38_008894 [Salix brachista]
MTVEAQLKEQGDGSSPSEQKGGEIKSRDIGAAISTPTKRKSKKKLEAASTQVSSPSETHTQTADVWPAMNFKFILGVALVSIIIGAILGKRYCFKDLRSVDIEADSMKHKPEDFSGLLTDAAL